MRLLSKTSDVDNFSITVAVCFDIWYIQRARTIKTVKTSIPVNSQTQIKCNRLEDRSGPVRGFAHYSCICTQPEDMLKKHKICHGNLYSPFLLICDLFCVKLLMFPFTLTCTTSLELKFVIF